MKEHQWVYCGWTTEDGELTKQYLFICPECGEKKTILVVKT